METRVVLGEIFLVVVVVVLFTWRLAFELELCCSLVAEQQTDSPNSLLLANTTTRPFSFSPLASTRPAHSYSSVRPSVLAYTRVNSLTALGQEAAKSHHHHYYHSGPTIQLSYERAARKPAALLSFALIGRPDNNGNENEIESCFSCSELGWLASKLGASSKISIMIILDKTSSNSYCWISYFKSATRISNRRECRIVERSYWECFWICVVQIELDPRSQRG